jgi:hypothetical protein
MASPCPSHSSTQASRSPSSDQPGRPADSPAGGTTTAPPVVGQPRHAEGAAGPQRHRTPRRRVCLPPCQERRSPSSVPPAIARGGPAPCAHKPAPAPRGHRARCGRGRCATGNAAGGTSRSPAGAAASALSSRVAAAMSTAAWCAPAHRSALRRGDRPDGAGTAGVFAKVPGRTWACRMLTRVLPLGRAAVTGRGGKLYPSG